MSRMRSAFVIALVLSGATSPVAAQDWRTISGHRQVAGEQQLKVEVEFGAGQLQVEPGDAGVLYRTSLRYDAEIFRPVHEYSPGALRIGVSSLGDRIRRDLREGGRLALALTPDLPLDVNFRFGAAEARIELGGLRLRRVDIETGATDSRIGFSKPNPIRMEKLGIEAGATKLQVRGLGNANIESLAVKGGVGEITLDFTGRWNGDTNASIDLGLGKVLLRIPRGLGVKVTKNSFLVVFNSEGLIKRGNDFYSPNWDSAARKLTVEISGALGVVEVDWVDPNDEI